MRAIIFLIVATLLSACSTTSPEVAMQQDVGSGNGDYSTIPGDPGERDSTFGPESCQRCSHSYRDKGWVYWECQGW